jgi:hypothetical protein
MLLARTLVRSDPTPVHAMPLIPDAGQVYFLPPEFREGPDKGDRPHLLLSLCDERSEVASFAYGSTKATDALRGAAHVLVDPFATAYRGIGLSQPTYFYPSRLLTFAIVDLPPPSGRIVDELPPIRQALQGALGIGHGVTRERNVRGANRRGRIAKYAPSIAEELGAVFGLVITEPGYSRAALQQTTVPILDASEYDMGPGDVLIDTASARWVPRVFNKATSLILAVPMITSVYERDSLVQYSEHVISESTMREVEAALGVHFGF